MTPAAEAIVRAMDSTDPRPLWVRTPIVRARPLGYHPCRSEEGHGPEDAPLQWLGVRVRVGAIG